MIPPDEHSVDPAAEPVTGAVSRRTVLRGAVLMGAAAGLATSTTGCAALTGAEPSESPVVATDPLLSEPYLLDPGEGSTHVAWCTESKGSRQVVLVGAGVKGMTNEQIVAAATGDRDRSPHSTPRHGRWRRFTAESQQLSLTREDKDSRFPGGPYSSMKDRPVWRHLAKIEDLSAGRTPYLVVSIDAGTAIRTEVYSLAPAQPADGHVQLLLTSDHQMKPLTAANLQMAMATVGLEKLDGVLMAGDCVNHPDRASEWFDTTKDGKAFFANFTGRGSMTFGGQEFKGAPILQYAPIYPSIGNHEVMGRRPDKGTTLKTEFEDPQPVEVATKRWDEEQPAGAERESWIAKKSWNTTTYEELFPFPRSDEGGPRWYSRTIGDIFLINLFVASIWRRFEPTGKGKFQEDTRSLGDPTSWGYGDFIFEPIKKHSRQYDWLTRELRSERARKARYRVVMFHHSSHGLGWNSVPPFTDPVQHTTKDDTGKLTSVTYSYDLKQDYVLRDIEPLMTAFGVNLVLNAHSHIWNRFRTAAGVNWLETSNVGDSFGAFDASSGQSRAFPAGVDLVAQGDPGGLTPIVPTIAPLTDANGKPLPYVADKDITVYSILDSAKGTVRSYRFDPRTPAVDPILFDEFTLARRPGTHG